MRIDLIPAATAPIVGQQQVPERDDDHAAERPDEGVWQLRGGNECPEHQGSDDPLAHTGVVYQTGRMG